MVLPLNAAPGLRRKDELGNLGGANPPRVHFVPGKTRVWRGDVLSELTLGCGACRYGGQTKYTGCRERQNSTARPVAPLDDQFNQPRQLRSTGNFHRLIASLRPKIAVQTIFLVAVSDDQIHDNARLNAGARDGTPHARPTGAVSAPSSKLFASTSGQAVPT
jgi:hypothetical protein